MQEDQSEEKFECEHAVEQQPSSFGFDTSVARLSAVAERRSWADRWKRSPRIAQVHRSQYFESLRMPQFLLFRQGPMCLQYGKCVLEHSIHNRNQTTIVNKHYDDPPRSWPQQSGTR